MFELELVMASAQWLLCASAGSQASAAELGELRQVKDLDFNDTKTLIPKPKFLNLSKIIVFSMGSVRIHQTVAGLEHLNWTSG